MDDPNQLEYATPPKHHRQSLLTQFLVLTHTIWFGTILILVPSSLVFALGWLTHHALAWCIFCSVFIAAGILHIIWPSVARYCWEYSRAWYASNEYTDVEDRDIFYRAGGWVLIAIALYVGIKGW